MIKVGINGFGRIGRFVFRAAQTRNDIQIVGINDLCPVDYLAYMLKYDTMHGKFEGTIEADVENSKLIVNGNAIRVTAERNPANYTKKQLSFPLFSYNFCKFYSIFLGFALRMLGMMVCPDISHSNCSCVISMTSCFDLGH